MNYKKKILQATIYLISCMMLFSTFACSCDGGVGFYEDTNIATYRNFGVPDGDATIRSFPENLDKIETINDYYFVANFPPIGHTSWEIFLDVTYSEENFDLELARLSNFNGRGDNEKYPESKLKFDKGCVLFNFPTYVAWYDAQETFGHVYEYISIDESNFRIIYVFLDCPSRKNQEKHKREIKLSSEYQPKNYYKNMNEETLDGYYFYVYVVLEDQVKWFDEHSKTE